MKVMLDRKNVLANLDVQMNRLQVVRDFLARADQATLSVLRSCLKEGDPDFFADESTNESRSLASEDDAVRKSWGVSAHGKPMYRRGEVAAALYSMLVKHGPTTINLGQAYELMRENDFPFKGSDGANIDTVRRALKLLASKGALVIAQKNSGSNPIIYQLANRL